MENQTYITNINAVDTTKVLLLIDAAIQAYHAFDAKQPTHCCQEKVTAPAGFEFIEGWTGVDAVFGHDKTIESYGLVFRSISAPYTYIFAFRGTDSVLDVIDDLGAALKTFVPHAPVPVPDGVKIEAGFYDIYRDTAADTLPMQQQLFQLLDAYQASDKPMAQLYITGHSLGSALSELFTLDVALSRPEITASNINYACPRLGNEKFVDFYQQQPAQQQRTTQTLRVQNSYDKVPCVPLEKMGYQHLALAYLVAFREAGLLGELNLIARHASSNYQAVLQAAAENKNGLCIDKNLKVAATGETLVSVAPDPDKVCQL